MAAIDEIARDVFRISIHVPAFDLQFNHFLVGDEEPLLVLLGPAGATELAMALPAVSCAPLRRARCD
jgi:hypothetical protein